MTDPQHEETFADTERKLREIITTLRAQLAEQIGYKNDYKAAFIETNDDWQEAKARADRAEAALAAQIEVDAEICTYIIQNYDCMKADKETYQPMWVQKVAKGMVSLARQDIRNQPHDRTALDRYREKVLREAAKTAHECNMAGDPQASSTYILALIEKEKTK